MELRDYQEECVQKVIEAFHADPHGEELLVLPTGCHRAGQGILMYDGTIKPVEEIAVGDLLMGSDSTPRRVLVLHRGQDEMYEVCPTKGKTWVVNKGHVLSLVRTSQGGDYPSTRGGDIHDVSISDWLNWSKTHKHIHKLFRVAVDFPSGESLPMHPYLLGVLLGDGGLSIKERIQLTNLDAEVVQEVERILQENGLTIRPIKQEHRAQSYYIGGRVGKGHPKDHVRTVKKIMSKLGLFPIRCEDRFIPHSYKTASRQDRLELLAGLMDTDGHCRRNAFDFISKSQQLADDVIFVARSLGLAAYKTPKQINGVTYYRVSISGDCSIIPTRIPRKQAAIRRQKKDVLRTGFTCKPTGTVEAYYGFTLDGDGRYLLDDFTVTHNSGKTVIFSHVIERLSATYGINTLIIAHTDELLNQAADKYRMVKPTAVIGKVGGGIHEYGGEVTVASIDTISRPNHLKQLKHFDYRLVVIDEAHRSAAPKYQKVLQALQGAFVLKVTATPDRLDGKPIINKPVLYQKDIIEMVLHTPPYLCTPRAIAIRTETNLDEIKVQGGDFNEEELEQAINVPKRNKRVVDAYLEHAPGRLAICFAVSVNHAEQLAYTFNDHGVQARVVSGKTSLPERKKLYQQFREGNIHILCNAQVLIEGFDVPEVSCVIMARPTKSRALFIQCIGRGLRLAPNKTDCIILDLTDNTFKHRLQPQNLAQALELDLQDGESIQEAVERKERKEKEEAEKRIRKLRDKRHEDVTVNLLERMEWVLRDNGLYVMEIGPEKHRIALQPSKNGAAYYTVWARLAPFFIGQKWTGELPLADAQAFAEREARKLLGDNGPMLVDRNAPWRNKPATEAQLATLDKFGIGYGHNITCGEASDLLDEAFGQRNTKKVKKKVEVGA